uniref:Uncharacterized protein n=1 Tax=Rhizophora mucronata TaxID=61149 RepID=A0A2P2N165_RHIMU
MRNNSKVQLEEASFSNSIFKFMVKHQEKHISQV